MDKLVELFCDVDDFCRAFIPQWTQFCLENRYRQRHRQDRMSLSEIMVILVLFHMSAHRNFKTFYLGFIWQYHHKDFPTLLSYTRFISVAPSVLVPLCCYFTRLKGKHIGITFIDSTCLRVCRNIRIPHHQVFKGISDGGKRQWDSFMNLSCI
ncbi:transposase [Xenorhabdus hominickii]|uniref:Transposase n=1 Tax=Xenorhabdus hominickii TaxID=351679 RepID=A0A2G0QDQ1_XENHO|nr:transposase [Xenorhabdus hominickii]